MLTKKMASQTVSSRKVRQWEESVNRGRKGATYFLGLENVLQAKPVEYYDSRDMDSTNQKAVMQEWEGWMATFGSSKHKVLVDLSRMSHNEAKAAKEYLIKKALVGRKLDMLAASREQLRDNEAEMTSMLKSVPLSVNFFDKSATSSVGVMQAVGKNANDHQNKLDSISPVSPEIDGHERRAKELDGAPVFHLKRRESNSYDDELDEETATSFSRSQSSTWHWEGAETPPSHRSLSSHTLPVYKGLSSSSAFALLNQVDVWKVDDIDLLSKFNDFKRQQAHSRFSLALDGIADVTPGSTFSRALSVKERSLASVVSLKSIDESWQCLSSILSRVCGQCSSFDEVVEALRHEDTREPVVDYLRAITYSYSHYLEYHDEVPRTINEREGFGDLTWPFIRGALKLVKIPSRCFEIPVIGTKERRNTGRDLSVETEEQAPMADGVAVFEDYQIYLAEASTIYDAKSEKEAKDKFKLVRCMRDSWNSQIKSISREAVPPSGLAVFGSTSFGDETKFYAMDFAGTYRLKQVGRMLVPLRQSHFASRMETCVRCCLRFALELEGEIKRRSHLLPAEEDLTAACDMIEQTRTTPVKESKKRRVSGVFSQ
ncbi:MAG: hypothetical protein J3R72DRAFT_440129 [Linnemannia gamsii]|nr:MAG: hypothetical protein J3R72DRAFT_440129 [Linnemannia gamsii]